MSDRRRTLEPGSHVGPYEILEWIGAGGMGEVYRARDTRVDRQVALKVLPQEYFESEERRGRFAREARVLASLNHPGIAVLYSFEEIAGRRLIVMELVEGQTLAERLASGPLPLEECLSYAVEMAEALGAAHEKGVVHRDLKPGNVMIGPRGRVKVLDFGLAKMLFPEAPGATEAPTMTAMPTAEGTVMGTIAYMSPEQASGRSVDFRSDVFALGSILHEMAAGKAPFARASAAETLAAILKEKPPSPRAARPELPAAFESIVRRCLAKNPGDRYASMRDLGEDLARVRQAAAPAARGARPAWIGAAVTLLSLGVFAAVFFALRAPRSRPAAAPAPAPRLTQVTDSLGLDIFPTFSPDGAQIAYCSDRDGKFEIYVRQLAPGGREIRITSDGRDNFQPAWSPDGRQIAYASRALPGIWLVPALGGEPRRLTTFGSRPAWSPDGATIAFQSGGVTELSATSPAATPPSTLWTVPAAGGESAPLTRPGTPVGGHGAPVFSPDGTTVVFAAWSVRGELWSLSVKGGSLRRILPPDEPAADPRFTPHRTYFDPAFSPKGDFLYFAGTEQSWLNASLWRSRAPVAPDRPWGAPERVTPEGTASVRQIAVSAGTGKVAYAALSIVSNLWSLPMDPKTSAPNGEAVPLTQGAGCRTTSPRFSPDGSKIAFISCRAGSSTDVWLTERDGRDARPLTDGSAEAHFSDWYPGGDRVAYFTFRGGKRELWSVTVEGRSQKSALELPDDAGPTSLSSDGTLVAYSTGGPDRELATWVAPLDGRPPRRLTPPGVSAGYPCWSHAGRTLAVEVLRPPDDLLATVPAAGGPPSVLVDEKGLSWPYDFSPDDERISFAGQRDGIWNVYWVARKDGTVRRLTNNTRRRAFLRYPAWSPQGDRIVYEMSETTGNVWLLDPPK